MKSSLAIALLCLLTATPALAGMDYLSLGGGGYDFDKDQARRKSVDYRVEYRWGVSLLPMLTKSFNSVEPFFQVHPTIGFEGNSKGATYGNAGFNMDIPFLHYGIFTWGEAVGAWGRGNDTRDLGSIAQFRSQLELGVQFDNKMRVTGFISHISNAHMLSQDPGAEILGAYLHIPLSSGKAK